MAIPNRQIGWGTEENLLWQISKQLEKLTAVTYNSKKTLLDVEDPYYNDPAIKAKIETFSGAFSGTYSGGVTTPFLEIDLNQTSGGIIEYSTFSFDGSSITGTIWFTAVGTDFSTTSRTVTAGNGYDFVDRSQVDNIVSFFMNNDNNGDDAVEILYTLKLFTLPMYND